MADITLAKSIVPAPNFDSNSYHFACKKRQAIAPPVGVPAMALKINKVRLIGFFDGLMLIIPKHLNHLVRGQGYYMREQSVLKPRNNRK